MSAPVDAQSVVVIQDASSEVCWDAIRWVLQGLSLKTGDKLTLISLLKQFYNPSPRAYMGAKKSVGYASRENSPMLGANRETVDELTARKMEEYQNSVEFIRVTMLYQMQKVVFNVMVLDAGQSAKVVALEAARELSATWVILDRKIKKDRRYFLEKLSCGISRMTRYNNVEKLRGPKEYKVTRNLQATRCSYDEMLPGPDDGDDLFSIELFPIGLSMSEGSTQSTISNVSEDMSTACFILNEDAQLPTEAADRNYLDDDINTNEMSDISICSICKTTRPLIVLENIFSYTGLLAATEGFSPKNLISAGEYGAVYKGELMNEVKVAVKEQKYASFGREKIYESEVEVIRNIRHKNVVILLGSCSDDSKRFLVYEYVCNGSLDQHIADQSCRTLSWKERLKIVLGASRGLHHLHKNNIIHRDIRPKKILLTHDYEPMLGGFGLARTEYESDISCNQQVTDTSVYLAPEYVESGKITTKADVYAFGVVLLELTTGVSPTDKRLNESSLLEWARPLIKGRKYAELIDPKIVTPSEAYQFFLIIQLTEKCLCKDPHKRLSMHEVVLTLEHVMDEYASSETRKLSRDSVSVVSRTQDLQEITKTVRFERASTGVDTRSNRREIRSTHSPASGVILSGRRSNADSSWMLYKRNIFKGSLKSKPHISYDEMLN